MIYRKNELMPTKNTVFIDVSYQFRYFLPLAIYVGYFTRNGFFKKYLLNNVNTVNIKLRAN